MKSPFTVDEASNDDQHFYVDTPLGTFALQITDEGLLCDIFPLVVSDSPVASCYAFTSELTEE